MSSLRANRRGIFALVCCTAAFTTNDALTKLVVRFYPVGEVLFVRSAMTIVFLLIVLTALRQIKTLTVVFGPAVIARSLFDSAASALFVTALAHMRLADLSAIVLASPLLMTMLTVLVYKEFVGWRRWTAIVVGLIGTLFVVKPSPSAFDVWAIVGLGAAFVAAARDVITRRINPAISTLAVTFLSAVAMTLTGLAISSGEQWQMLATNELALLALAAAFYSIATYLLVVAFRGVDISVVSPFRYTLLIWAGFAGYIAFGELPDGWSIFGAALIVGTGLYMLHRETVRRRYLSAKATPEL